MNPVKYAFATVIAFGLWPMSLAAQTDGSFHPIIENDFYLSVGAFLPDKDFKIRVDGTVPEEEIDFEEVFNVSDSETTGSLDFRWRFGEKWSVAGQYWRVSDSGSETLTEDVEWEDVVFREGTFAEAGVSLDVARVFLGRQFSSSPQHEFGAGLGFHWMEIDAFIQGQILTSEGDTELYRGSVDAGAPLPNIGAWYNHSWSPKWALTTRVDWLSVSFGDYSGGLWDVKLGVNWAVFEHIGLSASWNFFKLDVDVDKSDWRGAAEISQSGPFIAVTATW
jgi:hypothetical protein